MRPTGKIEKRSAHRKGNKKGGLLTFDILPIELTQRQGVLFILPVGDNQSEFPY